MPKMKFKNGVVRNVPAFRAKALVKTGAATPVKKNTYQTAHIPAAPSNTMMTRQPRVIPAAPLQPSLVDEAPVDELSALRADYQERFGKKPFHGWDAETLRQKMVDAE